MTEKEKMLAGELYDCGDPELLELWHLGKDLARKYNLLDSHDAQGKKKFSNNYLVVWAIIFGLLHHSMLIMDVIFSLVIIVRLI